MTEDVVITSALVGNKTAFREGEVLPTVEESLWFSQEELMDEKIPPLGIHQIWRFHPYFPHEDVQMLQRLYSPGALLSLMSWISSLSSPSSSPPPFSTASVKLARRNPFLPNIFAPHTKSPPIPPNRLNPPSSFSSPALSRFYHLASFLCEEVVLLFDPTYTPPAAAHHCLFPTY